MDNLVLSIENLSDNIYEALEEIEHAEQLKSLMIESIETGDGLTKQSASIVLLSLESMRNRLGIKEQQNILAVESFSTHPKQASKIAIEGLGDFIKTVWENILKAIRFIMDKIKSLFGFSTKDRSQQLSTNIKQEKKLNEIQKHIESNLNISTTNSSKKDELNEISKNDSNTIISTRFADALLINDTYNISMASVCRSVTDISKSTLKMIEGIKKLTTGNQFKYGWFDQNDELGGVLKIIGTRSEYDFNADYRVSAPLHDKTEHLLLSYGNFIYSKTLLIHYTKNNNIKFVSTAEKKTTTEIKLLINTENDNYLKWVISDNKDLIKSMEDIDKVEYLLLKTCKELETKVKEMANNQESIHSEKYNNVKYSLDLLTNVILKGIKMANDTINITSDYINLCLKNQPK